jgi:ATP-binding cassette, subfamily B, bacterial
MLRRVLLRVCRRETRLQILLIIVAQLILGAITVGELQMVRRTVEVLEANQGLTAGASTRLAILVGLHLLAGFVGVLISEFRTPIAESIHRAVSLEIADTAAHVPLTTIEDPAFHNRLQRIVSNSQDRVWSLVFGGVGLISLCVTTIAIGIALLSLAPIVLPAALLSVVPLWIAFRFNARASHRLWHALTEADRRREYLERTLTSTGAAKEVRTLNLGPIFSERIGKEFDTRRRELITMMRSRIRRTAIANLTTGAFIAFGIGLLLFASRNKPLGTGVFAATALALYQLLGRLRSITGTAESLQEARHFFIDYVEYHNAARLPVAITGTQTPVGPLVVDTASYTYPGTARQAVTNVSMSVEKGSLIAIVGDNGSGKSTLVKLLCGLLPPDTGVVRVGTTPLIDLGHPLPMITSVMFQDYVRYELSLSDNITLSDRASISTHMEPTKGLEKAMNFAGLSSVLERLKHGDSTILSRSFTDGAELSLGQWQRVALARALFRTSNFLILDEPTASLDALSEDTLLSSLDELRRDRGIVLITHRLSTARRADEIIVMDDGHIVERGSHEQLLEHGGIYANRFKLQAQPYETDAL